MQIIGIAADRALEDSPMRDTGFILFSLRQLPRMADWGNLQVQFSGPPAATAAALRRALQTAGRQQMFLMSTMVALRDRSLLQDRLLAAIGRIYAGLVLVLTALGLIGLLLFFVSSRDKEIAIRVALGAEKHNIRLLVAGEAVFVTAAGLLAGIPASFFVVRTLTALLYGLPPPLLGPWSESAAIVPAYPRLQR